MAEIDLSGFDFEEVTLSESTCEQCGKTYSEECPACNPPFPKVNVPYAIVFAVDMSGFGWLIEAPEEVQNYMNEASVQANMEDGGFIDLPEAPGLYRATAHFKVIQRGSWDSPETDCEFQVRDAVRIYPEASSG